MAGLIIGGADYTRVYTTLRVRNEDEARDHSLDLTRAIIQSCAGEVLETFASAGSDEHLVLSQINWTLSPKNALTFRAEQSKLAPTKRSPHQAPALRAMPSTKDGFELLKTFTVSWNS